MAPFTVGTIAGSVQSSERLSVYGRIGDAFALTCAAACVVAVLRGVRGRRGRLG